MEVTRISGMGGNQYGTALVFKPEYRGMHWPLFPTGGSIPSPIGVRADAWLSASIQECKLSVNDILVNIALSGGHSTMPEIALVQKNLRGVHTHVCQHPMPGVHAVQFNPRSDAYLGVQMLKTLSAKPGTSERR